MSNTMHMVWALVPPMYNRNTGEKTRDAYWRCMHCGNTGRKRAERWASSPVTDGGHVRPAIVVEIDADRAIMLQDETFSTYSFHFGVLRHDVMPSRERSLERA